MIPLTVSDHSVFQSKPHIQHSSFYTRRSLTITLSARRLFDWPCSCPQTAEKVLLVCTCTKHQSSPHACPTELTTQICGIALLIIHLELCGELQQSRSLDTFDPSQFYLQEIGKGVLTHKHCQSVSRPRVVRQENMVMGLAGPGTKYNCGGEGQQQFTRNMKSEAPPHEHVYDQTKASTSRPFHNLGTRN
jgi:hypothetical protein